MLVVPDRVMLKDEYQAVARKLSEIIDIEMFDMSGTDVRGADLATADLHRTSLKGAIYNDETRLPNEFATEVRGLIHERDLPEDESDEKAGD